MIEEIVLGYLQEKAGVLDPPIGVFMETEQDPPGEFFLVEKTGSSRENQILRATFAVQSYAGSMYRAAEMNQMAIGWLDDLPDERDVFSVELNSDYNFTDVNTRKYRYQAVFDIVY